MLRLKVILCIALLLFLAKTAEAAVDDGQTPTNDTPPTTEDGGQCSLGGGVTCEYFSSHVNDPDGDIQIHYGFLVFSQGVLVNHLASTEVCFPADNGLQRCLCGVSLEGEGFSTSLYSGSALSNEISFPISELPSAPDGKITFTVEASFSAPGGACGLGFNAETVEANCKIDLDSVVGQYPGHQDPPVFKSHFLVAAEDRGEVVLDWDDTLLEEGFRIFRREVGYPWSQRATAAANQRSYRDPIRPNTSYEYKILAFNEYGVSLPSDIASVTTRDERTLIAPELRSVESLVDGRVVLQWSTRSTSSTEFIVQRKDGLFSEFVEIARFPASTWHYTDWREEVPDLDIHYSYRVVAQRGAQTSFSNEASVVFNEPHSRTRHALPEYCSDQDVNGDGFVTISDALLIVSDLRIRGAHAVDDATRFYDVNGDSLITFNDALLIVYSLRAGECQYPTIELLPAVLPESEPTVEPPLPSPAHIEVVPGYYSFGGVLAAVRFVLQVESPRVGYQPTYEYRIAAYRMSPQMGHLGWRSYFYTQGTATAAHFQIAPAVQQSLVEMSAEELNRSSFYLEVLQKWNTPTGVKWVSASQPFSYQHLLLGLLAAPGALEHSECGDGLLDVSRGEQCDHGSDNGLGLGSYCLPNCRIIEPSCYQEPYREDCSGLAHYLDWHNSHQSMLISEGEQSTQFVLPKTPQLLSHEELLRASVADTLQYANVDGDKDSRDDACVRKSDGLWCSIRSEFGFEAPTKWSDAFGDTHPWLKGLAIDESNYGTLRFVDLNADGKADVCARGVDGLWCALSDGAQFGDATIWNAYLSDRYGFREESKWRSIRFANVDGDAAGHPEVCARLLSYGLLCGSGDGTHLHYIRWWLLSSGSATADINKLEAASLQLVDLNADGRVDICGINASTMYCSFSTGYSFTALSPWFHSDLLAQTLPEDGESVEFKDVNADALPDLCLSTSDCFLSTGTSFDQH